MEQDTWRPRKYASLHFAENIPCGFADDDQGKGKIAAFCGKFTQCQLHFENLHVKAGES